MGRCCGGKNAGKPISLPRYLAGLGVFCTYHTAVAALLRVAELPRPDLRRVRDFHGQLFRTELKEILAREGINEDAELVLHEAHIARVLVRQRRR